MNVLSVEFSLALQDKQWDLAKSNHFVSTVNSSTRVRFWVAMVSSFFSKKSLCRPLFCFKKSHHPFSSRKEIFAPCRYSPGSSTPSILTRSVKYRRVFIEDHPARNTNSIFHHLCKVKDFRYFLTKLTDIFKVKCCLCRTKITMMHGWHNKPQIFGTWN